MRAEKGERRPIAAVFGPAPRLSDVLAYKARSDAQAERAFRELVAQAQKLAIGYE